MRRLILGVLAPAALALSACVTTPLPPPNASFATIQAVRQADLPAMRVGTFTPAPGKPTRMDKAIQVRADSQTAPSGSYAKFLGDVLTAELQGAGRYDAASPIVISGVITDTHVDSVTPIASARLAARFRVERAGAVVFEKELKLDDRWQSDYMAVLAVPDAFNHYTSLYTKLAHTLLTDPEFIRAVRG